MRSMTGFGRGGAPLGTNKVMVELRAVNHRYLDVRLRLAGELSGGEAEVEQLVRSRFSRGRLELTAKLDSENAGNHGLDREMARRYLIELEELRRELGLTEPVSINVLGSIPDICRATQTFPKEEIASSLAAAVEEAIESVLTMRRREGDALARDLENRLSHIEELIPQLQQRASEVPKAASEKLRTRIDRLLEGAAIPTIDEGRLAQEVAILADRCDVSEELTRLQSHVQQFRKIAAEEGHVGRRLDFLLQEMAREASTTGSKAQDAQLQHLVVEVRGELTKMREQIQNVE